MNTTILGIDAGGTGTRVRARLGDQRVFDGWAGPSNITSTPVDHIVANLAEATSGCPAPDIVAGCFAGLSNPQAAAIALEALEELFPRSEFRLAADYVAAALASPTADVVVLAGTGSVAVSRTATGVVTTGGLGHLLGDRGSAFRYGQALLEHLLVHRPTDLPGFVADDLARLFGSTDRVAIVRGVYDHAWPAEVLGRLAPTLTRLAAEGDPAAERIVGQQSDLLAEDVAVHIGQHVGAKTLRVELAGGVWKSDLVVNSFRTSLVARAAGRTIEVRRANDEPIDGAIRLGSLGVHEFDGLVQMTRRAVA